MADSEDLYILAPALFKRLTEAAEKLAEIADKVNENLGAAVSQLDEIRAEVSRNADNSICAVHGGTASDGTFREGKP